MSIDLVAQGALALVNFIFEGWILSMTKKIIGLFLILCLSLSLAVAVHAGDEPINQYCLYSVGNEFNSLTSEQVANHRQLGTMTDEELFHSLGVSARSIMIFDRYVLDKLTDEELEILNTPFREIIDTLNERYGTNTVLAPFGDKWWCRDAIINRLTGCFPFEVWFNMIRQGVEMDISRMQNNALNASIMANNLSSLEFDSLQYGIEYSYITIADAANMLREGYELREVIIAVESQITDVSTRSIQRHGRGLVWSMHQSLGPWGHPYITRHYRLYITILASAIQPVFGNWMFNMSTFQVFPPAVVVDLFPGQPTMSNRWVLHNGQSGISHVNNTATAVTITATGSMRLYDTVHHGPWSHIFRVYSFI